MKHEFSLHSSYCSVKFLSKIIKLCEINVICKKIWFIQISSLLLFSLNLRHYSITSSLIIIFQTKGKQLR